MRTQHFGATLWLAASLILVSSLASCGGGGYGGGGSSTPASTSITLNATLSGASETPPNASAASGTGSVTVDTASKVMTATETTTGISGTASHIHDGAAGVAGPVIFPLTEMPAGSGKWSTSVTLTDAQLAKLKAGGYYFNVHSAAFPAGEIRGQILPPAGVVY